MSDNLDIPCYLCGAADRELVHEFTRRPEREVDYGIPEDGYLRRIYRCRACSVFLEVHNMLPPDFYQGAYNDHTYQGRVAAQFDRIMNLPEGASDNRLRAARIAGRIERWGRPANSVRILDVGSGLCVFLAEMKRRGYWCACIDPDPRSAAHALQKAGVDRAHAGTLADFPASDPFDVITFNKVLEHVMNPVAMLRQALPHLAPHGFVYVELPDGEAALSNAPIEKREEFCLGHYTNFDERSYRYLAGAAGLDVIELERIHEPSDKYSIWGVLGLPR